MFICLQFIKVYLNNLTLLIIDDYLRLNILISFRYIWSTYILLYLLQIKINNFLYIDLKPYVLLSILCRNLKALVLAISNNGEITNSIQNTTYNKN